MDNEVKKKKSGKKPFIILIIAILVVSGLLAVFFLVINKDGKFLDKILNNDKKDENKISDTYNGIYKYREELGETFSIYSGCTLSGLEQYIVVVNDNYYVYDSTCMATFFNESGNTEDLSFEIDLQNMRYYITKENKIYKKEEGAYTFQNSINVATYLNSTNGRGGNINLNSFNLIMKNTQRDKYYYSFNSKISNADYKLKLDNKKNGFFDLFVNYEKKNVYSKKSMTLNNLPELSTYTTTGIIILEKDKIEDKYKNKLILIRDGELVYNTDKLFPISIQNVELTSNNSIFIKYSNRDNKYHVLVGNDDKFCVEDSSSDEIVNYEFTISYDYANMSFTNLEFVSIGRAKDGCSRISNILEESKW